REPPEGEQHAPPGAHAPGSPESRPNPLPALERWKILDNLRRSLVPPAVVLLLLLGWTVLPGSPWLWSGVGLVVVALPLLLQTMGTLVHSVRTCSLTPCAEFRKSAPAT